MEDKRPNRLGWMLFLALLIGIAFFTAYAGQHAYTNSASEACMSFGPFMFKCELGLGDFLVAAFTGALWFATWKLVKGAEASAVLQLRAYLSVDKFEASFFDHHKKAGMVIQCRNRGQTPASGVECYTNVQICYQRGKPDFALSHLTSEGKPLAPSGEMSFQDTILIPEHMFSDVQNGAALLYGWGKIIYKDVFGESRCVEFRGVWNFANGSPGQFILLPDGNRAD